MAAAIAAAAARWGDLSITMRLVLLGVLFASIAGAAELLGKYLPMVGRVLDHLSAYLVFPVVATASALTGFSWRENLLVGGAAAAVAVGLQGRRKDSDLLVGSTAAGAVVAAGGLAAVTGVPVAIFIGALSVLALLLGWQKRATLLAAVGAGVPMLAVFPAVGIGRGVLSQMGASGSGLPIGMVVGGILSLSVLTYLARSKQSIVHAGGALSVLCLVIGGAIDLVNSNRPLYLVPGLALVGAQMIAVRFGGRNARTDPAWRTWLDAIEIVPIVIIAPAFLSTDRFAIAGASLMAVGYWLSMRRVRSIAIWTAAAGFVTFTALATATFTAHLFGRQWWVAGVALAGLSLVTAGSVKKSNVYNMCGLTVMTIAAVGFVFDSRVALDVRVFGLAMSLVVVERSVRRLDVIRMMSRIPLYAATIAGTACYLIARLESASAMRYGLTMGVAFTFVAAGAIFKHRMALITGAALTAITVVVAFADELAELPVWAWAMGGGLGLLILAGTLEHLRSSKQTEGADEKVSVPTINADQTGASVDPFDDGLVA